MIGILQAVRQLLGYLFLFLCLTLTPIGWYFIYLLPKIKTDKTAFDLWISIDRLFCRISHGTYRRTISGITGQYMDIKKRYKYQAKVIDYIMLQATGEENHSRRSYHWELKQGYKK